MQKKNELKIQTKTAEDETAFIGSFLKVGGIKIKN